MYGFKDTFLNSECKAKDLLKQLQIEIPYNLEGIMKELDIEYQEKSLSNSVAGMYIHHKDTHGILVNENISHLGRKRFTIAHELGHYWIDTHNKNTFSCSKDTLGAFRDDIKIEKEADVFAATFLMPEKHFKGDAENLSPSIDNIIKLSEKYNTSITSTAIRYIKYCLYPCAIAYMIDNKVSWVSRSKTFIGDINKRPINCYVNDMFCTSTERITERIYSNNWVSGVNLDYVVEDAILYTNLNHALVLIIEEFEDEEFLDEYNY